MRTRALLALPAAIVGLAFGPSLTAASASDASSTHTYLQADYALMRNARSHLRAAEAIPRKILAQVKRECPHAAASSPQDPESTQLSNEVIGTIVLSAYNLGLPAIRRYVRTVSHLSWSSRGLTSAVRSYAAKLGALTALAPPPLCADVRAWAASGFKALSPGTVRFDRIFEPAWVAVGELPGQLARFESAGDRGTAARAKAIEVELTDGEARAVEPWGEIMNELGVEP